MTRRRPWLVFLAGSIAQVLILFYGVGLLGETSRYLGILGAAAALFGVAAAVVTGPVVGAGVALVGGVAFVMFVTEFGGFVNPAAIAIAIVLWTFAAVLAGMAGRAIRRRAELRESLLSQALAESEASKSTVERSSIWAQINRSGTYEAMVKAICQAARDTFAARSASLYRHDRGRIVLLGRDPATSLMPSGWQVDPAGFPGLMDTLASGTPGIRWRYSGRRMDFRTGKDSPAPSASVRRFASRSA